MIMKEYKYVEVKFEAKGVLFHSASEPKEIDVYKRQILCYDKGIFSI